MIFLSHSRCAQFSRQQVKKWKKIAFLNVPLPSFVYTHSYWFIYVLFWLVMTFCHHTKIKWIKEIATARKIAATKRAHQEEQKNSPNFSNRTRCIWKVENTTKSKAFYLVVRFGSSTHLIKKGTFDVFLMRTNIDNEANYFQCMLRVNCIGIETRKITLIVFNVTHLKNR